MTTPNGILENHACKCVPGSCSQHEEIGFLVRGGLFFWPVKGKRIWENNIRDGGLQEIDFYTVKEGNRRISGSLQFQLEFNSVTTPIGRLQLQMEY